MRSAIIKPSVYADAFLRMECNARDLIRHFTVDGFQLWPVVRQCHYHDFSTTNKERWRQKNFPSTWNLVRKHYECFPEVYRLLRRLPKGCILIRARRCRHTELLQGKRYDPYLDPVSLEAGRQDLRSLKINLTGEYIPDALLPVVTLPWLVREEIPVDGNKLEEPPFWREYKELCFASGVLPMEYPRVWQEWHAMEDLRELYEKILDILQPRSFFEDEYYTIDGMTWAWACRRKGIPCVDYQHGHQSWPHIAYQFHHIPENGFDILPEWFFHWGDISAQQMARRLQGQHFHKTAVAGKPAYISWKRGDKREDPEKLAEFEHRLAGRIPICATIPLDYYGGPMPIFRAIVEQSPSNWVWLLRKHPIYACRDMEMLTGLEDRIETELCSSLNLHDVLAYSCHVVTGGSTVSFEALSLHNQSTTFLLPEGKSVLGILYRHGHARYADNVQDALASIRKGMEEFPSLEAAPHYITTDISLLGRLLTEIKAPSR